MLAVSTSTCHYWMDCVLNAWCTICNQQINTISWWGWQRTFCSQWGRSNTAYLFSKVLQTLHTASIKRNDRITQRAKEKPHQQTHAHIPTKAHIFRKTRSYSIVLKPGTRGGKRSPEAHGLKTEGTSGNLPINEFTDVSLSGTSRLSWIKQQHFTGAVKQNTSHTLLWSPRCLCFHCFHLVDPHWSYQSSFAPKITKEKNKTSSQVARSSKILAQPLLNDNQHIKNTLTLTLMILLWKLLRTTTTSPASAGESVPSCLQKSEAALWLKLVRNAA